MTALEQIADMHRARRVAKYVRYRATEKGRAATRRHNDERVVNGYFRRYDEARTASGDTARRCQEYRDRERARHDELFADSPEAIRRATTR